MSSLKVKKEFHTFRELADDYREECRREGRPHRQPLTPQGGRVVQQPLLTSHEKMIRDKSRQQRR